MRHELPGIESLMGTEEEFQLPTMKSGLALLRGDASEILPTTLLFLGRTAEIALGIGLSGNWNEKSWKHALAGSAAIQAYLLAYAYFSGGKDSVRLPSSQSAEAFLKGEPGSLNTLALHWLGRSMILSTGMLAAGARKNVVEQALWGGAVIELAILMMASSRKQK